MMNLKPFLLASLPSYLMFTSMILGAIGVFDFTQFAFNNPFPSSTPSVAELVYFALFTVSFMVELEAYSKLVDRFNLRDIRVRLPRHWRSVMLDVISWFDAHESWQVGFVIGGIVAIGALGEALIYLMQVMHVSVLLSYAVGFAGLFVLFLGLGVGQVLVRSTICPVGTLLDEELNEILAALPKLTREDLEYMKRNRTFVPSPKAKRAATILFGVAIGAWGSSLATIYWGLPSIRMPFAYLGAVAMMIGIVLIGFPVSGSRVSSLSRVLRRITGETKSD